MTRPKPEPLPCLKAAFLVAIAALERHKDTEALKQVEAALDGKTQVAERP